jgi:DNA-directed RNA polymerase subunit RPC12/RpoP
MADKPPRPILHLKLPSAEPAEDGAPLPERKRVRLTPIAPGRKSVTVREFIPPPKPQRAPRPPRFEAPPPPKPVETFDWKCKPCGKGFDVGVELGDEDAVRCPACNARLGLARDFRADPPNLAKVRARLVAKG